MSGQQSTEPEKRGAVRPQSITPEIEVEKPQIISSTSFYISAKIKESSTGAQDSDERDVNVENIIATIKQEMKTAMVTPASNFSSAEELVEIYGSAYSMQYLALEDQLRVAEAYLEGVSEAKTDGRYFGRNPTVIKEEFGNDREGAVNAFIEFAAKFGYTPSDQEQLTSDGKVKPGEAYSLFDKLCFHYKPGKYLVHSSEEGNVDLDKTNF